MRLSPAERAAMWDSMPARHPGKTMLRLGMLCEALKHEPPTETQRQRLDTELLPLLRRVESARSYGIPAAPYINKADSTFADIMGDWRPSPDNPIRRQVRAEIGVDL